MDSRREEMMGSRPPMSDKRCQLSMNGAVENLIALHGPEKRTWISSG